MFTAEIPVPKTELAAYQKSSECLFMNRASSEDVRVFEVKGTPPCLQEAAVTLEPRGGRAELCEECRWGPSLSHSTGKLPASLG